MKIIQHVVLVVKKYPKLYGLLILPYYCFRFLLISLREKSLWFLRYPPGHFGSTIPSQLEIQNSETDLFNQSIKTLPGINLKTDYQLELLKLFSKVDKSYVFNRTKTEGARYYYENPMFNDNDALILYCFLQYFKPKQLIEIGSGFSSALMLDVQESFLNDLELTFIDPDAEKFEGKIESSNQGKCTFINKKVQEVSLDVFSILEENSILFVDSSHVLKIGSDLSTIMYSILPVLDSGVLIHFHDIFWPLEYPKVMIDEGRCWNEIYILRSFLQYNDAFEIIFFPSYLEKFYKQELQSSLKDYSEETCSSLWLRKK